VFGLLSLAGKESLGALMLRQLERGYEKPAFDAKQTESESM
jgi:hypothetical protein